jgi:hypothetical protein
MEKLVAVMSPNHEYRFLDMMDLCREQNLFPRLVGSSVADEDKTSKADTEKKETESNEERGKKNILGRIFTKFRDRIFPGNRTFHIERRGSKTSVFFIR